MLQAEPQSLPARRRIGHLTTVDISLRYLLEAQLVGALQAGYEVIGISAPGDEVSYVERLGVRHVALPTSTRSFSLSADARAICDLARVLRQLDLDLLHTHNPKSGVYGRIVGRMVGIPHVLNTVHGLYATREDRWLKRAAVYSAESVASRFSHCELVQNEEDLELLARKRITSRRKLVHLGNGVDLARFRPRTVGGDVRSRHREMIRSRLGIGSEQVVVGAVARLVAEKGYRELFDAVDGLPDDVVVLAIGPADPQRPDALDPSDLRRAEASGVRLVGHQTDIEKWYAAMDIFALPSYREGLPRSAMEASASGLPVVATDIRGCRQVVDDGVTGLLVPPRDAAALAAALGRLAADGDLRNRMGVAARARAEHHFDEADVVSTVLRCYSELLG